MRRSCRVSAEYKATALQPQHRRVDPICALLSQVDTCSTAVLRTLNGVLSIACLACFAAAYAQLHPRLSPGRCLAAVSSAEQNLNGV